MSSPSPQGRFDLTESGITIPSDSENYDANNEDSSASSNSPMILYSPPTFWGIFRGAAINLLLPFINGLMLGFGELFAHEAAFRLGWASTKVRLTMNRCAVSIRIPEFEYSCLRSKDHILTIAVSLG